MDALRSLLSTLYGSGDPWKPLFATAALFAIPIMLYSGFGAVGWWLAVVIFVAFLVRLGV